MTRLNASKKLYMPTKQSYIDSDSDSNLPISLRNKILLEK